MKKIFIKTLSLVLTFVSTLSLFSPVSAVNAQAKLYETYGDSMIFKQNEDAILAGTANAGSKIVAEVKNSANTVIATCSAVTQDDGIFNIKFTAPAGSFEEYTITLFANGEEFAKLEKIVFGELWLASGQSNMDLGLLYSTLGAEMKANGEKFSRWIRFCAVPFAPEYNGSSEKVPYLPQNDIKGCKWFDGQSDSVYEFSAVAAFFAEKLFETLNMPLGVIQSSVGGSSVRSWLAKDEIDNNSEVKEILKKRKLYISEKDWDEDNFEFIPNMSGNYNKKIHPLKNFRLSGIIWYQGESDIGSEYGQYTKQIELLQDSYSRLFNYNGTLPLIMTQLASHNYSTDSRLQKLNLEFTDFQQADPATRAVTTIYDVPLTFTSVIHAIHPLEKHQVGRRMAVSAEGLVYKKRDTYTAATVESVELGSDSITVKFKNYGNNLTTNRDILRGFAVCGTDGVYLPANAEIISKDTVKIYSKQVPNPVSASYAISQLNQRSNLYSDVDGYIFPVAPFITDKNYQDNLWHDNGWTDCDYTTMWRTHINELSGLYNTWSAENAEISITADSMFSGTSGLSVKSNSSEFSVSPITVFSDNLAMPDLDPDLRKYKTISFKVRNNGTEDITFTSLEIGNEKTTVSPRILGEKSFGATIPADGNWHTIELDLNKIYYSKHPVVISLKNNLEDVRTYKFNFENTSSEASDISIDNIEFTAKEKEKSFFELIKEFFMNIFNSISDNLGSIC